MGSRDTYSSKSDGFEPIAIVGMGCRWPGDSESPAELWDFLDARLNAYSKFPEDRVRTESFYHSKANRPGSFYTEGGAFLKSNVRNFDHTFFGIHPREVLSMDPAQRKFVEVVYEALESSGTPLHTLVGSKTGCFVGNFNYDHQLMHYRDAEYPEPYAVTGGGITVLSNRVNYLFDLKGPSMTLDTACSSSMYALHLACSAIHSGECTAAIVGGSNLILTPECQIFSSFLGAVSPTSQCHTFDASADGYARADGIGALYIKSLSQAVKDGDPIRAIIRGTAINANGKTGGITHPSPDGQEAVIRRAYERAGLDPAATGYFECHGTGTAVGDPLEVSAIGRVFASVKSKETPLLIGSIKSNLGHSEPSSGIAGIMKAVLAIERGLIPPTVGLKVLNPNIDLKQGTIKIVTESTPWPESIPVRRASVNSFGYGGANAHTIVESAEILLPGYRNARQIDEFTASQKREETLANGQALENSASASRSKFLLPFSAHDERTLTANAAKISQNIGKWDLHDVAYTLSAHRSQLSHRAFRITSTRTKSRLDDAEVMNVTKRSTSEPTLGFIFTGQGAQWPQMGANLMSEFPSYLRTIRKLDATIHSLNIERSWTIEGVLRADAEQSIIHEAEISQPLVTAIQIALVDLLNRWGIHPSAVVGHSSGEIAAAYSAGLVSQNEAIRAAFFRGKIVSQNKSNGRMLAAGLSAAEARTYIEPLGGKVVVACDNSPESVTLSGDSEAIENVKGLLDADKRFARLLSTGGNAYHSPHMLALGQQYEDLFSSSTTGDQSGEVTKMQASKLAHRPARFFSSVYGRSLDSSVGAENVNGSYWRKNLESPVLFNQAVTALVNESSVDILVEIGPHSALQGPLRQISQSLSSVKFPKYLSAMVRKNDNVDDVLRLAGNLFSNGYKVDLAEVNSAHGEIPRVVTDLPHYQWQYSDVLLYENRYTREWRLRKHPRHDILGSLIPGGVKDEPVWRNKLRIDDLAWLQDHQVGQEVVFPSTGYLAMALEAATQMVEISLDKSADSIESYEILDVNLQKALIVPSGEDDEHKRHGVETLFTLRKAPLNNNGDYSARYSFALTSVTNVDTDKDSFVEHCRGFVQINFVSETAPGTRPANSLVSDWKSAGSVVKAVSSTQWYEKFASIGLEYGPTFQGMTNIKGAERQQFAEATVGLTPTAKTMTGESRYILHPAVLDAAMQLCIVAAHSGTVTEFKRAMMPVSMRRIQIWPKAAAQQQESVHCISRGSQKGLRGLFSDITILGAEDGAQPVLEATDIVLISSDQGAKSLYNKDSPYTRMVWKPQFRQLDDKAVTQLYPPIVLDAGAVLPSLNRLALHQLIHWHETCPDVFARGSSIPHLQRLLDWTQDKLRRAYDDPSSPAKEIKSWPNAVREKHIADLSSMLNTQSSESRLMCHLYNNLGPIYNGEKTGIQVALQDNLLLDNYEYGQVYREGNKRLASIIALLAHEKPDLKILEVGAGTGSATREILAALDGESPWRQYTEYCFTDTTPSFLASAEDSFKNYSGLTFGVFDMEKSAEEQGFKPEWDLVVASNVVHATSDITSTLSNISSVLSPNGQLILLELTRSNLSAGLVLGTFSDFWKGDLDPKLPRYDGPFLSKDMWRQVLPQSGFSSPNFFLDDYHGDNVSATVVCATVRGTETAPSQKLPAATDKHITLVHRDASLSVMSQTILKHLQDTGFVVDTTRLTDISELASPHVISLVELEKSLFQDVGESEWKGLQRCIKRATSILWVTSGSLMDSRDPLLAMMSGIARGLQIEMAHLRLAMVDLDCAAGASPSLEDMAAIVQRLEANSAPKGATAPDTEFRRKDNVTYISRLVPDKFLNEQSQKRIAQQTSSEPVPLQELRFTPLKLAIDKPSVLSTIHFVEDADFSKPLPSDEVEIEVAAVGINNKDLAVLTGRHHSDTFSDECSGTIVKVGASVENLAVGDRVYCQSFAKFGNFVRDKAIFCQKLEATDDLVECSTLPIAFCTALYGLVDLGRLRAGETVLVQSATGAVGLAAIQIARICGAEIYATVGTPEKKAELLTMGYGIAEDHIFASRDSATPQLIYDHTKGRGIDVILSSARGELMHEYWSKTMASMGRFVEIGRTEVLDNGSLRLDVFRRNATFASFDLEEMSITHPQIIGDLMSRIAGYKAKGLIKTLPLETFHVSEIDRALMQFAKAAHIGKLVVTFEHDSSRGIQVRRSLFGAAFDPNAAYLLVGCLGGLGRSFSRWAVERGARHLVYLSRSGAATPVVAAFVSEFESQGVEVQIIKGDVASLADVEAAVARQTLPIKGVVQGALTLHDGLFESMTVEDFHATTAPRVQGTMNLQEATKDMPLDFFQLWSSWTTMFGTATQSNYLASNSFMDAFARQRRSYNQPVTSVSLSQVLGIGIVSYMPEYQQAMIRNGFYGNDELEFLQYCDVAATPWASQANQTSSTTHDPLASSHLLVGIEPAGLGEIQSQYPLDDMVWAQDRRFTNLIQATHFLASGGKAGDKLANGDAADGEGTVTDRIRHKIARLLYVSIDEVDEETPISSYGIDSMVAAEVRNWLFQKFGKDVPLLKMLASTTNIRILAEDVTAV